ncbi:DUF1566 domain-containing protein [Vibrio sp. SBT000027]|uniref:Lcl domain-containing protein n=1 Tax=Vibrio sp. SBT000027 TaxID=1803384 RepID=UPI000EF50A2B|nr:DUF1566 domain-containing protein [Vibrio sp. SBT000027]
MAVAKYKWGPANQYCNQLDYDGKQDWRLPTKDELVTLYNSTQGKLRECGVSTIGRR